MLKHRALPASMLINGVFYAAASMLMHRALPAAASMLMHRTLPAAAGRAVCGSQNMESNGIASCRTTILKIPTS